MRYSFCAFLIGLLLASPVWASLSFDQPMIDAADRGATGEVARLLEAGTSPNIEGKFGTTALMRSAISDNFPLTEILLERGAQPDKADIGGATALHLAARMGHTRVAALLIRYGASIDATDLEGWTPLMRAVQTNKPNVVSMLIKKGAGLHVKTVNGQNLLTLAVLSGNPDIVKKLLETGMDGQAIAQAHDSAIQRQNKDMIALLEEASGRGGQLIAQTQRYDDYGVEQQEAIAHPVNIPQSSPADMAASMMPEVVGNIPLYIVEEKEAVGDTPYYFLELGKGKTPWDVKKQLEVIGSALRPGVLGEIYLLAAREYYGASTFRIRSVAYTDKYAAHQDCLSLQDVGIKCKIIQTHQLPEKVAFNKENTEVPLPPSGILPSSVSGEPAVPQPLTKVAPVAPVVPTPSIHYSNSDTPHSLLPDTMRQAGDNVPDYHVEISGFPDVNTARQYWAVLYNKEKLDGVHSEVVDRSLPGSPTKKVSVFVKNVPSLYTATRICSTARNDKFQCLSIGE